MHIPHAWQSGVEWYNMVYKTTSASSITCFYDGWPTVELHARKYIKRYICCWRQNVYLFSEWVRSLEPHVADQQPQFMCLELLGNIFLLMSLMPIPKTYTCFVSFPSQTPRQVTRPATVIAAMALWCGGCTETPKFCWVFGGWQS